MEVDLLSFLVARYIGTRSYGAVYGTIFGFFSLGPSFGPSLLGHLYDRSGSYALGLELCSVLLLVACALLLSLGRYPANRSAAPAASAAAPLPAE